jgi:hypothetical protein
MPGRVGRMTPWDETRWNKTQRSRIGMRAGGLDLRRLTQSHPSLARPGTARSGLHCRASAPKLTNHRTYASRGHIGSHDCQEFGSMRGEEILLSELLRERTGVGKKHRSIDAQFQPDRSRFCGRDFHRFLGSQVSLQQRPLKLSPLC